MGRAPVRAGRGGHRGRAGPRQDVLSTSRTVPRIFRTVGSGTSSSTPLTPTNVQETVSPAGLSKANAVALPS